MKTRLWKPRTISHPKHGQNGQMLHATLHELYLRQERLENVYCRNTSWDSLSLHRHV